MPVLDVDLAGVKSIKAIPALESRFLFISPPSVAILVRSPSLLFFFFFSFQFSFEIPSIFSFPLFSSLLFPSFPFSFRLLLFSRISFRIITGGSRVVRAAKRRAQVHSIRRTITILYGTCSVPPDRTGPDLCYDYEYDVAGAASARAQHGDGSEDPRARRTRQKRHGIRCDATRQFFMYCTCTVILRGLVSIPFHFIRLLYSCAYDKIKFSSSSSICSYSYSEMYCNLLQSV